jgi:hypothetical protein
MRDKCGACKKGHDIRFCPYPNTEDGRTEICPVCDTSNHAWYKCDYYGEKDAWLQWDICWVNRRGLPKIVHGNSLYEVFVAKIHQGDNKKSIEERIRVLNTRAGPLSPDFVKRLMPPKDDDDFVHQQLLDGRRLPWDLDKEVLESNTDRPDKVIEDPETKDMQGWGLFHDTKTDFVPKAGKLNYFRKQAGSEESRGRKDHPAEL